MPHDDITERALLGAIMAGHQQMTEVLTNIKPEDFFDLRHQEIARTILRLHGTGSRPDLLTVHDELSRSGQEDDVGGFPYLASLLDGIALRGDVHRLLHNLRRSASFRHAARLAESVRQLALHQSSTAESLLESAITAFSNLQRDLEQTDDDGTPYFDSATEALSVARQGARVKIYSGIDKLDQWTGGFREGELIVVTAETGTGKSLLAAQIRARACRDNFHALFCSGEMSKIHLVSRELATVSGVKPIKMRRDDLLSAQDFEALVKAAAHQCRKCRILDGELTIQRIRRAARKMKARMGLELLILDYDELIEAEGSNEFEQQRAIARVAKSVAIELQCVVILVSQLRKTTPGENAGKPTLQRLYGNAAKQKFASFIILADRPYIRKLTGDEKDAELQLLKSRDGRTGRIKATFNVNNLRFEGTNDQQDVFEAPSVDQ